jgi:hypothetical protein
MVFGPLKRAPQQVVSTGESRSLTADFAGPPTWKILATPRLSQLMKGLLNFFG